MTGCYLTSLPFEFMRGQADFEPGYASSYFVARDIQPPESLRRLVWPDLDRWRAAHLQLPEATEKVEPNLAAGGFLELLDRLRDVFLQVSITLFFIPFFISFIILLQGLWLTSTLLYRMLRCSGANIHNTTYSKTLFSKLYNIYNLRKRWPWLWGQGGRIHSLL